jgi:hypothetical protein
MASLNLLFPTSTAKEPLLPMGRKRIVVKTQRHYKNTSWWNKWQSVTDFRCYRAKNIPLSGTLLQEIATRLQIDYFLASNGWLDRFRKRNNISFNVLSGETVSAHLQAAGDWKRWLPRLLLGCAEEDIFNADENGVFYRQVATWSLT